jgi:hypothetical protein
VLAACTSGPGPHNSYEPGAEAFEERLGDPALAQSLVLESIRTERRDDRLHVQFDLRNRLTTTLPIEWTIVWFDTGGFRIDGPIQWTPAVLGGEGRESIVRTAISPKAAAFKLEVRRPATNR